MGVAVDDLHAVDVAVLVAVVPARERPDAGGRIDRPDPLRTVSNALVNPAGSAVILIAAFLASLFLATTFSFEWAMGILKPRFAFISAWTERYAAWQEERKLAEDADESRNNARRRRKQMIAQRRNACRSGNGIRDRGSHRAQELPRVLEAGVDHRALAADTVASYGNRNGESHDKARRHRRWPNLPSTTLLNIPVALAPINEDELRQRALSVEGKCREFEVDGTVQQIHPGPVVTTFEFKPEPGIKYSKITGLGDDLCLALEAESVRIDRMPGKSTVGIEVPNDKRATIMLRELLESSEYTHSNFRLPLALGKDITGKIVVSDLQKMPHLLAAGSTGTGKSVSINAMILSLLFHSRPDQMKMILIDPKASGARALSGHSSPARSGRDRTQDRAERAALGRGRNGNALQEAGQARRPQSRRVQRSDSAAADSRAWPGTERSGRTNAIRFPTSSSSSTNSPTS